MVVFLLFVVSRPPSRFAFFGIIENYFCIICSHNHHNLIASVYSRYYTTLLFTNDLAFEAIIQYCQMVFHPLRPAALALFLSLQAFHAVASKKLVLFAGPHGAAAESVEKFFYNHASGAEGMEIADGLKKWRWPKVDAEIWSEGEPLEKYQVFDALVTDPDNSTAQEVLYSAIDRAMNEASTGIILGSAEFDRVGNTVFTQRDGLKAMQRLVDYLEVLPQDVAVVTNYRIPRRDQWLAIADQNIEQEGHYKRFLCNEKEEDELLEILDTSMNPFKLAMEYRKLNWRVVVMDMGGIEAKGKDVAHAIACNVFGNANCHNGFVKSVEDKIYFTEVSGSIIVNSLSDTQHDDMDQLFRERDCYYQQFLKNDKNFRVRFKDSLWQGCLKPTRHEQPYESHQNPEVLLGALRSQRRCSPNGIHKMIGVLVNDDYEAMTKSTIHHGFFSSSGTSHSSWSIPLILVVSLGAGIYQIRKMKRKGRNFGGTSLSRGGMQEMKGIGNKSGSSYRDEPYDLSMESNLQTTHNELI